MGIDDDKKCAPGKKYESGSCFTLDDLKKIALKFNQIHQNNKIKIVDNKKKLLRSLIKNMEKETGCLKQICWLETTIFKNINNDDIKYNTFRPEGPLNNDWLSTTNINNVINQYQQKYKDFLYLGTVPYDFDDLPQLGISNINFNKLLNEGKIKIGMVINLDKHDQSGSHWVALYANLLKNQVYFFDSFAQLPGKRISKFIDKIIHFLYYKKYQKKINEKKIMLRMNENNIKNLFKDFDIRYNTVQHQFNNSECGVYSINFVIRLASDKENFYDITQNIKKDDEMHQCRYEYFRDEKK